MAFGESQSSGGVSARPSARGAAGVHNVLDALVGCAVIQLDVAGRIVAWNAGATHLFEYDQSEAIGRPISELLRTPPDMSRDITLDGIQQSGHAREITWRYTKSGRLIQVDVSSNCLFGDDGELWGFVQLIRDATEPVRTPAGSRHAFRPSEPKLIFGPAQDATFLIDEEGTILDANPTAEGMLGCKRKELVGTNLETFVPVGEMFNVQEQRWSADPTRPSLVTIGCRRKDGSPFPGEVNITAVELGSLSVQIVGVRDVTLQRIAQVERDRLLRLVESVSDFISLIDPQGNVLYQNAAAKHAAGRAEHTSTQGLHVSHLQPPWAATMFFEHALPMALQHGAYTYETVLLGEGGTQIPVSQLVTVHRNAAGEMEYASTITRDLRNQHKAEALLSKVAGQVEGMLYQVELTATGALHYRYVSPGIYDLYGIPPDVLQADAQKLLEFVHPDDVAQLTASVMESARTLNPCIFEYRVLTEQGIRWHQGRSLPERTPEGATLWYGFIWDVTDSRNAADELKQRKLELEDAIAALDAGFAMFTPDEQLIVCNDRYAQLYHVSDLLRHSRPTIETLLRASLMHPELRELVPAGVSEQEWVARRLAEFRAPAGPSLQRYRDRWIRIDDRKTANGGTVSMCTDVTAIKRAEFEATLQQQRLELATAAAGIGIWELELSTGELIWDARSLQQHDFEPEEFPGTYQAWRSRIHVDDLAGVEKHLRHAVANGEDFRAVFRVVHRDGRIRHVESRSSCLRGNDGAIVRIVGVSQDITEQVAFQDTLQRAAEAAQAASKAKAEFLATMSHEIRTPMNGVIGMTNLLMGTTLDVVQREYVETIRASGETLLTLINDILDFSKMEAGKLQLESVPFSIEQAVMESITLFTSQAEEKGVHLVPRLPTTPTRVIGDPTRLKQILLNLVSNALKFTKVGSVTVAVNVEHRSPTLALVEMRVTDTGIGMSPEHLHRLGEAFLQADASTTRQYGGTGLGLSICRSLVQLMNGTLSVTSELERGTTFVVQLPLGIAPPLENPDYPERPSRPTPVKLERVLVAEDNVVNQRVVGLMLRKLARHVDFAKDGREALTLFTSHEYDCVLMDGQMPEVDGLEATRQIRAFEAQTGRQRTPIVALTANALPGDREAFLSAGMDEYLTKPIRVGDLELTLSRVQARLAELRKSQ